MRLLRIIIDTARDLIGQYRFAHDPSRSQNPVKNKLDQQSDPYPAIVINQGRK